MRTILIATFLALLMTSPATAWELAKTCETDRANLCATQPAGSAAAMRCLRAHGDNVSAACRRALIADREKTLRRVRSACEAELANFCNDPKRGGRGPIRCLRGHQAKLTPACSAALPRTTS